jgi:WD40 repeat protein
VTGTRTISGGIRGPGSPSAHLATINERGTSAPAEVARIRGLPAVWWWVAAAALLLTIAWLLVAGHLRETAPAQQARPDLELLFEHDVPLDSQSVIAATRETIVLAGLSDLILSSREEDRPATRVALTPRRVLGATLDGELVLRDGTTAIIRNPTGSEELRWAEQVPADVVGSSPDTRWLVTSEGSNLAVYGLSEQRFSRRLDLEIEDQVRGLVVGTRLLALVDGATLRVWDLEAGRLDFEGPLTESAELVLAVHDDADKVAVGGWFDHVQMIDIASRKMTRLPRREGANEAIDLEFLLAGARLAVAERGGITLWTPEGKEVGRWDRDDAEISDIAFHCGRLLGLDSTNHSVIVLQVPGIGSERVFEVANDQPWAAIADPSSARVLLGNADGNLDAVDLETGSVTHHRVHTLGITSLACDADRLATASDDKTIAVWRLPELTVEWRSKAHDYLVNQLFLPPAADDLWSTSSDGTLKRWSWPTLEEVETIRTETLFGRRYSLAALWVAPDLGSVLLGTWNRTALVLHRTDDGSWSGRAHAFDPYGGYVIAAADAVNAVVLAGILHPFALAVLDLDNGSFTRLRGANQAVRAVLAGADGNRVLAFADNRVLDYRLRRDDAGRLWYRMAAAHHPTLGVAGAAATLDRDRVVVANEAGSLHVIDVRTLDLPFLCDVPIGDD